ncbi:MAG: hypothetical protein ACRD2N_08895 [Vicinamibacterales bacterium]
MRRAARTARVRRWLSWRRWLRVTCALLAVLVAAPAAFVGVNCYGNGPQPQTSRPDVVRGIDNYSRAESFTYLTLPEWLIVYSSDDYATAIAGSAPSRFPYFRSIAQYWSQYAAVCQVTKREYPFEAGYHVMLAVIGVSFSVEYAIKGLYENTLGRFSEWLGTHDTAEDLFAARTAQEYGRFMHTVPWYEFPFGSKLIALWKQPFWGPHLIRKWERRVVLTAEYGVKAIYGSLIGFASGAAYDAENLTLHAWIENVPEAVFGGPTVKSVKQVGERSYIVRLPRYESFTRVALELDARGVRWIDIAGNDEILVTAIADKTRAPDVTPGRILATTDLLSSTSNARLAIRVPVASLHEVLERLRRGGATIEHLYDY